MATEFKDLNLADQNIVTDALDAVVELFQENGLDVGPLDQSQLIAALVDLFERVSA
ncbi:hypothetical protein HX878_21110 [Pseudomonas veronii]|uniref:hypothetical protein n=1 Tax=Pseudomonas veronii TaxID=76761 RepID=UPI0015A022B6|nr:hypothetical protein [Pseudomonas veronii]NWD57232.1 hypothetical protein [Pseudomonas veronii]